MRMHYLGQIPAADRSRRAASPAPRLHAAIYRPAADDVAASPGQPLAARLSDGMQARLGADFSQVRVHTDPTARPAATEAGAPALASAPGSQFVIGDGGADKPIFARPRDIGNAAVSRVPDQARPWHGPGRGHQQTVPAPVQRSAVHDVLSSPGQSLPGPVKEEMEARLGADFSQVRVHTDAAARASAAEIRARAYTSGSHIAIGDGGADKRTLAHELTHVIQQRSGPVAGICTSTGLRLSDPSDCFERHAEANASRVMALPPVPLANPRKADGAAQGQLSASKAPAVPVVQRNGRPVPRPSSEEEEGLSSEEEEEGLSSEEEEGLSSEEEEEEEGLSSEEEEKRERKKGRPSREERAKLRKLGPSDPLRRTRKATKAKAIRSGANLPLPRRNLAEVPFKRDANGTALWNGFQRPSWGGADETFFGKQKGRKGKRKNGAARLEYPCVTSKTREKKWLPRKDEADPGEDIATIGHKVQWRDYIVKNTDTEMWEVEEGRKIDAISQKQANEWYRDENNLELQGQSYNSSIATQYRSSDAPGQTWAK